MTHLASLDTDALLKQCKLGRSRSSGPGGQHRNKVETAVTITHTASQISGSASERASQADNRRVALFRLRINLALQVRSPKGATTGGRFRVPVNPEHDDFPAVLAEALDAIADHEFDAKAAAAQLGCSTSQLIKLLRAEPRSLIWVNQHRGLAGMHALH